MNNTKNIKSWAEHAIDEDGNLNNIEAANIIMSYEDTQKETGSYPGQARRDNMSNPGDKDYDT